MDFRPILGDSNLLIHLANQKSAYHPLAVQAVNVLERENAVLLFASQNLAEFWNVCTRPAPSGLGLSIEDAARRLEVIEDHFTFLPETDLTDRIFKDLLVRYRVQGVQVHDARLAAVMLSNGVKEIVTFDRGDFQRYKELTVIHPDSL